MNRTHALLIGIVFGLIISCNNEPKSTQRSVHKISGTTMGSTPYHISYVAKKSRPIKLQIDSLLIAINQEVSTYEPESIISQFNRSSDTFRVAPTARHFINNLDRSRQIFRASGGNFDPTVMPLVNYWGFGYEDKIAVSTVDSMRIDSMLNYVGMDRIDWRPEALIVIKSNPHIQLDFSAIAKGYAVDEVARYLTKQGLQDYLIEIGGEVIAKGTKPSNKPWTIGLNTPKEGAATNAYTAVVQLPNIGVATSGNYRNYYEVDGQKYSHTINPKTGFPERSPLLSASVFMDDCMSADAWATAFMTMGYDQAQEYLKKMPNLHCYFMLANQDGDIEVHYNDALKNWLVEPHQ